jgi:hypothetical protein
MGRGDGQQSPGDALLGAPSPRTPAFDPDAIDALNFQERAVWVEIADDDPDPNQLKAAVVQTADGEWRLERGEDGIWRHGDVAAGPEVTRELEVEQHLIEDGHVDHRKNQGPDPRFDRW